MNKGEKGRGQPKTPSEQKNKPGTPGRNLAQAQGATGGKQGPSPQPPSRKPGAEGRNSAQGTDATKGKRGQSTGQKGRPLPIPPIQLKDQKEKALRGVNQIPAFKNESDQKLKSTENEKEDISKEQLQTLAQELNITEGSPQEAACRPLPTPPTQLKDQKEKALRGVNLNLALKNESDQKLKSTENEKEEGISKEQLQTLAQELNITEGSPQEIIEAACREIQNSKEMISKDQMKRKVKELEDLTKIIFKVTSVQDKQHDIDKTKAKIQDLHRCQEDLTVIRRAVMDPNKGKDSKPSKSVDDVMEKIYTLQSSGEELTMIKTAVMNPKKSKEFKPTQSAEEIVERINTLQRVECECLELKEIVFNKELLKLASFDKKMDESQRTVENAEKIAEELTRVCGKMETDQMRICKEVLGKDEQPSTEEMLKAVQSMKKAADESNKEIQRQKTELEKMEKEIAELKGQLTDARNEHQASIKSNQEKEQKLIVELNIAKSQKDNALTRAAGESNKEIQRQKTELEKKEKEIAELKGQLTDAQNEHHEKEQKLIDDLNIAKSQRDNALTRLSEVAGAKLTESNPLITDLSDPNRPEKIGEQFSELYDNLWTDVYEKLFEKYKLSERDSIHMLLQILEESYGYCKDISSKRYTNILAELTLWKLVEPNEESKKGQNTPGKKEDANTKEHAVNLTMGELQTLRTLLDSRGSLSSADSKTVDSILAKIGMNVANLSNIKKMLKSSLGGTSVIVQKTFWKQYSGDPKAKKEVLECTKPFLMRCVQICWLMLGQDPPVYLRFSDKSGDKFDKDVYREYTVSGKVLGFVVWPAIYLHENGPLLKKGVAQPMAEK